MDALIAYRHTCVAAEKAWDKVGSVIEPERGWSRPLIISTDPGALLRAYPIRPGSSCNCTRLCGICAYSASYPIRSGTAVTCGTRVSHRKMPDETNRIQMSSFGTSLNSVC